MAVLKCKMCGGDLNIEAGMIVAECEYCGSKQTVPAVDDEKKLKLYERAGKLLRNCEFDKAAGVFESIVAEYSEESEAYWGLVLCSYGIEYVDDPATGKKIPTCHRSSFESVMDNSNFELALEDADSIARAIYRDEAKQIEELRKGIIEVSSKEDPYDIFICYKETDDKGDRTIDSVIAQDVYDALTDKGYRVFFSRITLEDKLGQEYEPYIFAALNSAKVMLAFGTDYEYYNTVWVKNEWSRFLQLMTKDKSKHLIPCYKGIDAYDMPKEFAKLQAQDMGKVGAVQDLLRGIEKLLPRETQKEVVKETVVMGAAANTAPLLERAFMFLEDGDWGKADEFCEQVLNIDPKCAEAYLGKLMAELHVKKQEDLRDCDEPFDGSNNYKKAIRFGNNELVAELNGYIAQINTRKENARLDGIYNDAVKAMNSAMSIKEYDAVVRMFESISQWKDSANKVAECNVKIEEIKAKEEAERLEYERQAEITRIERERQAEIARLERERQAEITRQETEARAKRNKKIAKIVVPIICVALAFIIVLNSIIVPNQKYNDAIALMDAQQYIEAIAAFGAIKDHKDSIAKIEECYDTLYSNAINLMNFQKYTEAIEAFTLTEGYKDSVEKINECRVLIKEHEYIEAVALMDAGKYEEGIAALEALIGYKDSAKRIDDYYKSINERLEVCEKGETITFGSYEQDNNTLNGKEAIEWLVLDTKDNKALVISKYALDCQPYTSDYESITWEDCSLRSWLNNDFINSAFSEDGKTKISTVTVSADPNPQIYLTHSGKATQDKIFLLSITEVNKYCSSNGVKQCNPTSYAVTKGTYTNNGDYCWWWLRTPGGDQHLAAAVNNEGEIVANGYDVNYIGCGIRPAMWINMSEGDSNKENSSSQEVLSTTTQNAKNQDSLETPSVNLTLDKLQGVWRREIESNGKNIGWEKITINDNQYRMDYEMLTTPELKMTVVQEGIITDVGENHFTVTWTYGLTKQSDGSSWEPSIDEPSTYPVSQITDTYLTFTVYPYYKQ